MPTDDCTLAALCTKLGTAKFATKYYESRSTVDMSVEKYHDTSMYKYRQIRQFASALTLISGWDTYNTLQ